MPELPEVELLARHLQKTLPGRRVQRVLVHRKRSVRPINPAELNRRLAKHRFQNVRRRAKFLLFNLSAKSSQIQLIGHLGMTGRMYLQPKRAALPKHAVVVLILDRGCFVFEDPRTFGRMTLDAACLDRLGPEPLSKHFELEAFQQKLQRSRRPIHTRLLAQNVVAGLGNIYAGEALFEAGIHPQTPSSQLTLRQVRRLRHCIQTTLSQAIERGDSWPLNFSKKDTDGFFYFGRKKGSKTAEERRRVYGREGKNCVRCSETIQRILQTARSAFFCPNCQPR